MVTSSAPPPATPDYPRDLVGYGRHPPHAGWPNGARIAVQFVLNYEEGAESCVLDGDAGSEVFLSEIVNAQSFPTRHMSMESLYEYGSRAGVWRVLRLFERHRLPLTVFAVALAMRRNPEVAAAVRELGHEVACHGLRWISYQAIDEATERAHMVQALAILRETFGSLPQGWYTGRDSPNTRRLLVEHGGVLYDSDSYADDTNDMRFATVQGFNSGPQFFDYLKGAFDALYLEGDPQGLNAPKMLSVGLHGRLIGRPGRIGALERFIEYALEHPQV